MRSQCSPTDGRTGGVWLADAESRLSLQTWSSLCLVSGGTALLGRGEERPGHQPLSIALLAKWHLSSSLRVGRTSIAARPATYTLNTLPIPCRPLKEVGSNCRS